MEKSKNYVHAISNGVKALPDVPRDIFIFIFIGLISLSGFFAYHVALGDSGQFAPHIKIVNQSASVVNAALNASTTSPIAVGKYVGSRSGRSYYLPSCAGVKRIKEENKVWFTSAEEATTKGYHPAATCKEMQ